MSTTNEDHGKGAQDLGDISQARLSPCRASRREALKGGLAVAAGAALAGVATSASLATGEIQGIASVAPGRRNSE